MPFIILTLLSFILIGCVVQTWKHKPYKGVVFVYIQSPQDIQDSWEAHTGNKQRISGWARWWKKFNICQIHVPPLNDDKSFEVWRHELRHCQDGHFHKKSKKFK